MYAEHIRLGMWRRTHKEEVRRQEEAERQRVEREKRERKERERARRLEAERIRKLEERAARKSRAEEARIREEYEDKWRKLNDVLNHRSAGPAAPLRASDFPWPLHPGASSIDTASVSLFLVDHLSRDDVKKRKQVLRTAVLAYHPDRFDRLVARISEDANAERQDVRERGLRVSQVLNELLAVEGKA
jgi:flagellar biosynthesis GTPase FlhF